MNKHHNFWRTRRILVTGGNGFLGKYVVGRLSRLHPLELRIPSSSTLDLREKSACAKATEGIDLVIHLAGVVGGIGYNQKNPGKIFYDNLLMGTLLMEEARKANVKKFVSIGSVCAYPKYTPIPFREHALWDGYPEETNAPFGLAKKMLLVQGLAYRKQYGFNAIYLLPVNLYGPGDNVNLQTSHVIPALIRKFIEAKKHTYTNVRVWGTGAATREFLHAQDAARAIILACETYNKSDPVNIGANSEISIHELAHTISLLVGYKGNIVWDPSKPDGQPRRKVDTSKAAKEFNFHAQINLETGLKETIDWYYTTYTKQGGVLQ